MKAKCTVCSATLTVVHDGVDALKTHVSSPKKWLICADSSNVASFRRMHTFYCVAGVRLTL